MGQELITQVQFRGNRRVKKGIYLERKKRLEQKLEVQ